MPIPYPSVKMPGGSFEVPIVLSSAYVFPAAAVENVLTSTRNLAYEDIAKLNPFYEEYKNFWNAPSHLESTLSSRTSTKTMSGSIYSDPGSFYSAERSASPVMDHLNKFDGLQVPERLCAAFHSVNTRKPFFQSCESPIHSQLVFFDDDSDYSQRYAHVRSPTTWIGPDRLDLDLLDAPAESKGLPRKKLFGENGWLGTMAETKELPDKRKFKMFKGLGKKIKQHVEDIVSWCRSVRSRLQDFNRSLQAVDTMVRVHSIPFTHGPDGPKIVAKSPVPISLDSLTQAKLYSDMEFMICSSANHFLVGQYNAGRVSRESIRRTTDYWVSKNRPQVVEFQFDQATQRQLILSNVRTLDFHGESATNPILLHSNLQNWKAIVKEMSVRTFCLPDSAIRKHVHDIHKILDMLGGPLSTFLAFQELQMRTLSLMKEELKKTHPQSYHSISSTGMSTGDASRQS